MEGSRRLCVYIDDCMDMIRFDGINDPSYPEWFREKMDAYIFNEGGQLEFAGIDGIYALTIGDVIVQNKLGELKLMPVWMFTDLMYEVEWGSCCMKVDVLEYETVGTNEVVLYNKNGEKRDMTRVEFWGLFYEVR